MAEKCEESCNETVSCLKNKHQDKEKEIKRLNPIAKALLQGIYDDNCELSKLRGIWHVLRSIWRYLISFWKGGITLADLKPFQYKKSTEGKWLDEPVLKSGASYLNLSGFLHVARTLFHDKDRENDMVGRTQRWRKFYDENGGDQGEEYSNYIHKLIFPKPTGININMMPFIMDTEHFENCQLPEYLNEYWKCFIQKCPLGRDELGKVGYLTIQESHVNKGETQRRPGVHTDRPGIVKFQQTQEIHNAEQSGSTEASAKAPEVSENGKSTLSFGTYGWGFGERIIEEAKLKGGIYMASNTSDSCWLYNCEITNDKLIGELGDIEHLREFLPQGEVMEKDNLYWFTDRTPHEALPLKERTHRQFFRLVTSQVSLWYIDHSTKNPLGVVPNPEMTKLVKGSKFDKKGVVLVENDSTLPSKGT
eukprot:Seg857.2 transcript_id=Seg857.2/GoldUCD/mRNA.D3Y31 product="hypothetical protein" protein_id=Seg857.2/GoldUCD/D3Y31